MSSLRYIGKAADTGPAVATKNYVDAQTSSILTSAQVDSSISSKITGYATQSYANSQDTAKATKTYVDQQDALNVLTSSIGKASGPIPLDSSGLIASTYLSGLPVYTPATQYSTKNIITANVSVGAGSQVLLGQIDIPASGLAASSYWVPLVWGYFECIAGTASAWPAIKVRQGGSSGAIVAQGIGANRTDYHPCNIQPYTPQIFAKLTATSTLYLYGTNIGSIDTVTFTNFTSQATAILVPGGCG